MANIIRVGGGAGGGSKVKKMAISNLTEGTIVRIKEKGVETDYYLAQHDYQPDLNGSGRTLFVRKLICYSTEVGSNPAYTAWNTESNNNFEGSTIDTFMGNYKTKLSSEVRESMGATKIKILVGGGNNNAVEIMRSVFPLAYDEIRSDGTYPALGQLLPTADLIRSADEAYWTRTATGTNKAVAIGRTGAAAAATVTEKSGARPCFTLPNTATVLQEPNLDGSYTLSLGDDDPSKEYFKLTVVDGTEQPADVEDNTIWVNTDIDMGLCYLAPNAPENPEVGDVWVNTTNKYNPNGTNASTNILRVNDNPYLEVNVLNISQWDGTDWVLRDGSAIYANGAWTTMALWLFNYGTQSEAYPMTYGGGETTSVALTTSAASLTFAEDSAVLAMPAASTCSFIQFGNLIKASKYNKMTALIDATRDGSTSTHYILLSLGNAKIGEGATYNTVTNVATVSSNFTANYSGVKIELDISQISGDAYASIGQHFGNTQRSSTMTLYYLCVTA